MFIKWFKKMDRITHQELEDGASYLSAILGVPFFNPQNPGPDMSEFIKRHGTATRIFTNVRHDN